MRGFLSFLILFLLSKKDMNGQQISDELERRKGCRPSPGTIYPALKSLKEDGFIKETTSDKTITYTLTPSGKKAFDEAKTQFCRTFMDVF
jgi:DNA-binding PadR family transcriptional regulator